MSSEKSGIARRFPYRVVIIEDSAVIRGMMSRWLVDDTAVEVVERYGSVGNVLQKIKGADAEVVVLDIDTPRLNGLALLPKLLAKDPTLKILVVTAATADKTRSEAAVISAGAAGVIVRPGATREVTTSKVFKASFVKSVKKLGVSYRKENGAKNTRKRNSPESNKMRRATDRVSVVAGRVKNAEVSKVSTVPKEYKKVSRSKVTPKILAIGSSTGGPKALYKVFESMNVALTVPVVITQHMPPMFTAILAEHLTKASGATAREGVDGEKVVPGRIYVAPGDYHMVLKGTQDDLRIALNQGPEENYCRPSVDPLFRSVAKIFGKEALSLVLTGMGQDGCLGAKAIVDAGGTTIAQDEATSVVWGMPGAVVKEGITAEILPLPEIGPRVASLLKGVVR